MKGLYPVIFTAKNDEKDTYLVEIPDIKGLTEGYGLEDAMYMAEDYINLYVMDAEDDGNGIPTPSKVSDIDPSSGEFADAGDSFVSLVGFDSDAYRLMLGTRSVRRNVSLPEWLDQLAKKADVNVSAILQKALMDVLGVTEPRVKTKTA